MALSRLHFLEEKYKTGFSCTIHPSSGGFGLIAWLVRLHLRTRRISRITCPLSSTCRTVSLYGSQQGLQRRSGIHLLMFLHTESRSGNPLCATHVLCWSDLSIVFPYVHVWKVYFYLPVFKCHFSFTSPHRTAVFSMYYSTDVQAISLDSPSLKNITMWHLMTSCVPLVCVGIAEDTSQWTSPDRWTVKSSGTPGGTALEEEGGGGVSKSTGMSHQQDQLAIPGILTARGDRHHAHVTETATTTTIARFSMIEYTTDPR